MASIRNCAASLVFLGAGLAFNQAQAQVVPRSSLHLQPIGSVVSGSFALGHQTIPLPEGEFRLAAVNLRDANLGAKMVDVILGQMVDHRLRTAVAATTVLKWGTGQGWTDEPCKREDTLFRLDRVPFMKRSYAQNCLTVSHLVNTFSQAAGGVYVPFVAWIKDQGGSTPISTIIDVRVTRIELREYLSVRYFLNPEAFGCESAPADSLTTSEWHKTRIDKDAEKSRFVHGVIEFSKSMQVRVNESFEGRTQQANLLASTTPALLRCDSTPDQVPPPTQTTTQKPAGIAERLKLLEELRNQNLISPAEYDERRRKMLDSL
jgi:hypothetical protein